MKRTAMPTRGLAVRWWLLAGACLGIGIQFKLTMLTLAAPLTLTAILGCWRLAGARHASRATVLFLAALLFSLIPTAILAARDPDAFYFSSYRIHLLIEARRIEQGRHGTGTWNKFRIWSGALGVAAPMVTLAAGLGLIGLIRSRRRLALTKAAKDRKLLHDHLTMAIMIGCAGTLIITYVSLSPTWPDYVSQVLPFLILIGVMACPSRSRRGKHVGRWRSGWRRLGSFPRPRFENSARSPGARRASGSATTVG